MDIQEIKHLFFAYRNGVVADVLRRSGMPYKMIFGVDVPSITEIARRIGYDNELAEKLWSETDVRESRILATYLFDPACVSIDKARRLVSEVRTREEADMLVFRLIRKLDYANSLIDELKDKEEFARAAEALERDMTQS